MPVTLFARLLRQLLLWLAACLCAGTALAAACPPQPDTVVDTRPPRDRGLLWRITRDGRSSWLFGTLHAGKPAWQRFGPQTAAALRASDMLALEIDPTDPALADTLAQPVQASAPALPEALQQRLAAAFERACVEPELLARFPPLMQAISLSTLEARWAGLDTRHALELLLIDRARSLGLPVQALETAQQQRAALLPDDPQAALRALDQALQQLEDGRGRRVLQQLARAWEQGDLDLLEHYERWCECAATAQDREALRHLNDERNGALAAGIVARHQAGQRVFAAVGALHMTGPQALPRLLAAQGFVVERVQFRR